MSLRPAHQRALRATLRVTMVGALGAAAGCGSGPAPATPSNTTGAAHTAPATADECRAALDAAFPDGDPNWFSPGKESVRVATGDSDAELAACCAQHEAAFTVEEYRDLGCCTVRTAQPMHCTPWGPPMPPAMPA